MGENPQKSLMHQPVRSSSLSPNNKKNTKKQQLNFLRPSSFLALYSQKRSSNSEKKKKNKKKKSVQAEEGGAPVPPSPPIGTTTTTITRTKTILTTTILTSLPSPDEQLSLYLCVENRNADEKLTTSPFTWYKLDPHMLTNHKHPSPLLHPICSMPQSTPPLFCSVPTSDFKIYAIGGLEEYVPSSKAFVCDFSTTSPTWQQLPPMSSPKEQPAAVVSPLDGNLYAFGSRHPEVFTPSSNSWSPLPTPDQRGPPLDLEFRIALLAKQRNQIICAPHGYFLNCFDLSNYSSNHIELLNVAKASDCDAHSLIVGDVVYTFVTEELYACDLANPTPSFKRVYGLEAAVEDGFSPAKTGWSNTRTHDGYLSYIGDGKMCLVWHTRPITWDGKITITLLKFWAGKHSRTNEFCAVVDRRESYVVDGWGLSHCLAM